ncbi:MAG: nucleotidyltransferase domain-containing protein [Thermodesulfobacteriota bacterium]|nr:nucleotidyltransferase domain-containing protein [Thermodesulfobacteriota bacterium]
MTEILEKEEHFAAIFKMIEHLVEALRGSLGEKLISVVLYGSYARGQIDPESDIDLLVVAEGIPAPALERQIFLTRILNDAEASLRKMFRRESLFPYISTILKTPKEADCISRIYFDMTDEAKIFYDQGNFFQAVLRKVKKRLKELGAQKVQVGKMWYWDLKPDYKPGDIFEI